MLKKCAAGLLMLSCGVHSSLDKHADASVSDCPYNVIRHDPNGWLISVPEVHLDFWGQWDVTLSNQISNDWTALLNDDKVLEPLAEYGIHEGTLASVSYSTGANSTVDDAGYNEIDDSKLEDELNKEIRDGHLSYPSSNSIYIILLPPGIWTHDLVVNHWNGYHAKSTYGSQQYAYAVVAWTTKVNITISHELFEGVTNPAKTGWFDENTDHEEIGDLCNGLASNVYGLTVQKVWGQAICDCQ